MKIAKDILVNIEYTLRDEDGNLLNEGEEELIYLHGGYGQIFAALERALEGKKEGEHFCVTLEPEETFGLHNPAWEFEESLENLPEDICVDMELESQDEESGELLVFVVESINEKTAKLNANHPYAGLTLTFEGDIVELQTLTQEQIEELLEHEAHEHH